MTPCGSNSTGLSHRLGRSGDIVLLAAPDLLSTSASIVLQCVWKD